MSTPPVISPGIARLVGRRWGALTDMERMALPVGTVLDFPERSYAKRKAGPGEWTGEDGEHFTEEPGEMDEENVVVSVPGFAPREPVGRGLRIYVASRASIPERPAMWRRYRDAGFPIVSTWIDEDAPGTTPDMGELWRRIIDDETRCTALVLYVMPDDLPLKGALVEVGAALAVGARVYVVAPGCTEKRIGSWIRHPRVRWCETVEDALTLAATSFQNGNTSETP